MRLIFLRPTSCLLVFANWVAFLAVSAQIWMQANDLSWIQKLHWGSFLTDLSGLVDLTEVTSGSVWIAWLLLSICFSVVLLGHMSQNDVHQKLAVAAISIPPDAVDLRKDVIESLPEIQEKLKRLNRWLV